MSKELQAAIKYYAETYVCAVVGTTLEEAYSVASVVAHNYKYSVVDKGYGVYPDWCVADFVRSEANAIDC